MAKKPKIADPRVEPEDRMQLHPSTPPGDEMQLHPSTPPDGEMQLHPSTPPVEQAFDAMFDRVMAPTEAIWRSGHMVGLIDFIRAWPDAPAAAALKDLERAGFAHDFDERLMSLAVLQLRHLVLGIDAIDEDDRRRAAIEASRQAAEKAGPKALPGRERSFRPLGTAEPSALGQALSSRQAEAPRSK